MNRLFEIAQELTNCAIELSDDRRKLLSLEREAKAYERQVVPEGGWPGKNADERKAAEMNFKASDGQFYEYEMRRDVLEFNINSGGLRRDALIEERDAIRWTIRDNEQMTVTGVSVLVKWSEVTQSGNHAE